VILHAEVITALADIWIEVPSSEEQARICCGTAQQLCSEDDDGDDGDDAVQDEDERERRTNLFE
jgi:hypothetical protein